MNACDLVVAADDAYFASAYRKSRSRRTAAARGRCRASSACARRWRSCCWASASTPPRRSRSGLVNASCRRPSSTRAIAAIVRALAAGPVLAMRNAKRLVRESLGAHAVRAARGRGGELRRMRGDRRFRRRHHRVPREAPPQFRRDDGMSDAHEPPRTARRCSSPAARAASASRSRCAPRATAPTSRSPRRPSEPHPKLPGTIHTAAAEIDAGRRPARCRSPATSATRRRCAAAVDATVERLRRHRHPRQQRERDQPHRHAGDADEALRPHVRRQRARHVPLLAGVPAASRGVGRGGAQSAHPDAVAAAQPRPEVVPRPRRLHDGEIRDEHVRARHGRGIPRRRHRRQRAVAAHGDRDRGDRDDSRARASRSTGCARPEIMADAAHRDAHARRAHDDRQLLPRRGGARRSGHHRLLDATR